jgi:hypothetical protein
MLPAEFKRRERIFRRTRRKTAMGDDFDGVGGHTDEEEKDKTLHERESKRGKHS